MFKVKPLGARAGNRKSMINYPRFYHIEQKFEAACEPDVAGAVRREIFSRDYSSRISPGQTVAVGVGSRGVKNLLEIAAATTACLKEMGLKPFIMPAMGSHGAATGPGQKQILNDLGLTEETVGCPIVSNMDVVSLGVIANGAEVYLGRDAAQADHLVVINRVKPHTAFRAEVESGLCKILTVGCGKHQGALNMHRFGLAETITPSAKVILEKKSVLFGLAILENPREETHSLHLALPENFIETDAKLLVLAKEFLPQLPIDKLDILIVDEMGKNISGAGMDPNVVGFWRRDGGPRQPDFGTIIILDITPQSHGNATGIGLAELTTKRVMDQVDFRATYTNVQTSGIWSSAKLPMPLEDDRTAFELALSKLPRPERARIARIRNTLQLEELWVSETLLPELTENPRVVMDREPFDLEFDPEGRIRPMDALFNKNRA
ncbi:MAG: lactate racemase domain-containing protein [Pseudomonadota bacterium]